MNPKLYFLALALFGLILLGRMGYFFLNTKDYPEGRDIAFETQLQNQPKITARGQQVSLNLPNYQRLSVLFPTDPALSYGDRVRLQGKIKYFKASNGNNVAYMNYPKFILIQKGSEANVIYKVRENIIKFFTRNMSGVDSALMLGIVFGIKQQMPTNFYNQLQKTGLLHVIAASGMNITMVGGFLIGMFGLIFKRQVALSLSIAGILLYALLAGLQPSIVRAAIMGILVFSAQLTGRQNTAFLGLFTAGFIMLFINPSLIFDIGFQLSFLATFGLVFVRPILLISPRVKALIERSLIGEDLATTLTAQLVTLPILLINFGSYGASSILVNALVLWTVPILMIIGGLSALVGLVIEPIGRLIGFLALPFLYYFERVVSLFGSFGGQISLSPASASSLPVSLIGGYYLILLSIIVYFTRK